MTSDFNSVLPPVTEFYINPALIVHLLNSLRSILPGATSGVHTCQIKRQITFASYRVAIYTPGWRAAMWIRCLAEGQKCQALTGIGTRNPLIQSQGSIRYTTAPPHFTFAIPWSHLHIQLSSKSNARKFVAFSWQIRGLHDENFRKS